MPAKNILGFDLEELKLILAEAGYPHFCAKQIFSWIYKKNTLDFQAMSDLSLALRKFLDGRFTIQDLKLVSNQKSFDDTEKLLFKLRDDGFIEAVIIPAEGRVTACVSTQVGCKFACKFCASGIIGFKRNLTAAEIIEQLLHLEKKHKITHLVFMGTGEPLDNYENLLKAIRIINSKEGLNIGARRITISTCGIIPEIIRLAGEGLQIELSVSLHAADDKTRENLMPINKKYPVRELINACRDYAKTTNRQITFEYVLIKGINADLNSAAKLTELLKDFSLSKINLIPSNPVKEYNIEPPGKIEVLVFKDYLLKRGLNVTLRKSRGQDIDAACGQLRLRYEKG